MSDEITTRAFWATRAPTLHVSEELDVGAVVRRSASEPEQQERRARMRRDGFFAAPSLLPEERTRRMCAGIEAVRAGIGHEVFALVYDEFWSSLAEVASIVESVLGPGFRAVPMPYVNHVASGEAGFGAHRDRYLNAVTEGGLPNVATAWMSLTEASPERACLAVLPACFDPNFPDSLTQLAIPDVRDIRAVPVPAGSLVCFNQAVLHWGTRNVSPDTRMSFAFELERPGLSNAREPSLLLGGRVSLAERLHFVGCVVEQLHRNNIAFSERDLALAGRMRRVRGSSDGEGRRSSEVAAERPHGACA